MDNKRIQFLVEKFIENTATAAEERELMRWYQSANEQEIEWLSEQNDEAEITRLGMLAEINSHIGYKPVHHVKWARIAAAASILLMLSIGAYFTIRHTNSVQENKVAENLIKPGGNKAFLTLGNGTRITLNDTKSGVVAQQSGVQITKTAGGQLIYKIINGQSNSSVEYNTIETPRGGQYRVLLPDGTHVWLNAATKLTYPASFASAKMRKVLLSGEAYFEVAHNRLKPFIIESNGQSVKVLGTHFNINAYSDEPVIRTTLVEGIIDITRGTSSAILKPGQQAVTKNGGAQPSSIVLNYVDTEQVLGWRNGEFSFNNTDIKTGMREVGRWYDVDVVYEGKVPNTVFIGEIYRSVNLSKVLEILKYSKVNFRIEGRKIIVTP